MITLAIDSKNDLILDSMNNLTFNQDKQAVSNLVQSKLQINKGSFFLNPNYGVDFSKNEQDFQQDIKKNILELPHIEKILQFQQSYTPSKRRVSISTNIKTDFGPITLQGNY